MDLKISLRYLPLYVGQGHSTQQYASPPHKGRSLPLLPPPQCQGNDAAAHVRISLTLEVLLSTCFALPLLVWVATQFLAR